MKKSLIALAALATVATAAQAQSSVTIYGVIDVGVSTVNNVAATTATGTSTGSGDAKRVTGMNTGAATSRLGFRGTEDLGGGLKANFVLESEFLADDGSQKSTPEALFARASWVGLSGNFGTTQFGRINTFSYGEGAKFDPFGAANLGGYLAAGRWGYTRIENAIQYMTPKFSGLAVGFQTGTKTSTATSPYTNSAAASTLGEVAGHTAGNRNTGFLLSYDNGPIELSASYAKQNSATARTDDVTTVFARYTLGKAKLIAGYMNQDPEASSGTEYTSTFLGVNYALTSAVTLKGMAGQYESKTTSTTQKPKIYTVGANYALSKRTDLYVIGAKSSQDNSSTLAIASTSKFSHVDSQGDLVGGMTPLAGKDQTGYVVGIRHTF